MACLCQLGCHSRPQHWRSLGWLASRCHRMAMVSCADSETPAGHSSFPRSFFGQVPPIILAIILVTVSLPGSTSATSEPSGPPDTIESPVSQKSKLSRVDFKGSILFTLAILALLLPIELGGVKLPWSHPTIITLFSLSPVLLFVFIAVEKRQAEPILPLEIFHRRDAVLSFSILGLQIAAQLGVRTGLMSTVRKANSLLAHVFGASLFPDYDSGIQHCFRRAPCARRCW